MDASLPYLCRGNKKKRLHRELSGGSDTWATIVINGIDFLIDMTKMKLFGTVDENFEEPPPEPQPKLDDTAVASDGGDSSDHSVVGDVGADGKPNAAGSGAAQALAASAATPSVASQPSQPVLASAAREPNAVEDGTASEKEASDKEDQVADVFDLDQNVP